MASSHRKGKRRDRWLVERRKRFKAALAHGGFSVAQFAAKIHVTHSHLNYHLRGERGSDWVASCVRKIIKAELGLDIGEEPK